MSTGTIRDNFTKSDGGWTVVSYPDGNSIGNCVWSSGKITYTPAPGQKDFYFKAPERFHRDFSKAFGGYISVQFDKLPDGKVLKSGMGIVLEGAGKSISFPLRKFVQQQDRTFVVYALLSSKSEWRTGSENRSVTQATIQKILSQVTNIFIRGDIAAGLDSIALTSVSVRSNPKMELLPSVDVYYEKKALMVTLPPVQYAYEYVFSVVSDDGKDSYVDTTLAEKFGAPHQIGRGKWQPVPGKKYAVTAFVRGPPDKEVSFKIVDIDPAVVSAKAVTKGTKVSWADLPGATGYDITILEAEPPNKRVLRRNGITGTELILGEDDGLIAQHNYIARMRGSAGKSYGEWGQSPAFTQYSAALLLSQLKQRLQTSSTSARSFMLNEATLPPGFGHPDRALKLINIVFNQNTLTVQDSGGPILSDDYSALTLSGKTEIGSVNAIADIKFTVDRNMNICATINFGLPKGWRFSDSFKSLKFSRLDELDIDQCQIVLSTDNRTGAEPHFPQNAGANFVGRLQYRKDLMPVKHYDTDALDVLIGGPISVYNDGAKVHVDLAGEKKLGPLTAKPLGHNSIVVKNSNLAIKVQSEDHIIVSEDLSISGSGTLVGKPVNCYLDVPTRFGGSLGLDIASTNPIPIDTLDTGLKLFCNDEIEKIFPDTFKSLSGTFISKVHFEFYPSQTLRTLTEVEFSSEKTQSYKIANKIVVKQPKLTLRILSEKLGDQTRSAYETKLSGTFSFGRSVHIEATIPTRGDWQLNLTPPEGEVISFANILSFTSQKSKAGVLSGLPSYFQAFDSFNVDQVSLTAAVLPEGNEGNAGFSPSLKSVGFRLSQTGEKWSVLSGMNLSNWHLTMQMSKTASGWQSQYDLGGRISLGSDQNAPHFAMSMSKPKPGGDLVIRLIEDGFDLPGINKLLKFVGGERSTTLLPAGMKDLGALHIGKFKLVLDSGAEKKVKKLYFNFSTASSTKDWVLTQTPQLAINHVEAGITIIKGISGSKSYATGYFTGQMTVVGQPISVHASRPAKSRPWMIDVMISASIPVDGISKLSGWMLPGSVTRFLPSMKKVEITNAGMRINADKATLDQINFTINSDQEWQLIPNYVRATGAFLDMSIDNPTSAPQMSLSARLWLEMGGASMLISADKASPNDAWLFGGSLLRPVEIDIEHSLNEINLPVKLPYDHGFPRSIIVQTANAEINQTKGDFKFDATTLTDWRFNFGKHQLEIQSVDFNIHIEPKKNAVRPYTFHAAGKLSFASLVAWINFQTGNKPEQDTIVTADIRPDDVSNIQIPQIADHLTASDGTNDDKWSSISPQDYSIPQMSNASVYLNLTQNLFYLFGRAQGAGDIALIVKKLETDKWAFAVGLNLSDDFKFSKILPNLAVIDDKLTLKNAGLFVVSYEGSSSTLTSDIQKISSFGEKSANGSGEKAIATLPDVNMAKGMIIYGHLDFHTSSLFSNLLEIGDGTSGTAPVDLYGFIDKTDEKNTIFIADLPDITIANIVTFTNSQKYPDGIHLTFKPKDDKTFTLDADVVFQSPFGKPITFNGSLNVNSKHLSADLTLLSSSETKQIVSPFGIPGVVITELGAHIDHTFGQKKVAASGNRPARKAIPPVTSFKLHGDVIVGPQSSSTIDPELVCQASLATIDKKPILLDFSLKSDLSIADFFSQFISGTTSWPSDLIDITFLKDSKFSNYDKAADTNGVYSGEGYEDGFYIDAIIKITFIKPVTAHLGVQVVKNKDTGKFIGVKAEVDGRKADGSLGAPLNFFFLEIAGRTKNTDGLYDGSPSLTFDTTKNAAEGKTSSSMGLNAGYNLFKKPFGTADLSVKKISNPSEYQLSGDLVSDYKLPLFGKLEISFTYSPSKKLEIKNWPEFSYPKELIDFLSEIEKVAALNRGGCDAMAKIVTNKVYRTTFKLTPKFTFEHGKIYLVLGGKYELDLAGRVFLRASIPDGAKVSIDSNFSLDNIGSAIDDAIGEIVERAIKALIRNPNQIARFLVILAGKKAVGYVADLICRQLAKRAAKAAVDAGVKALEKAGDVAGDIVDGVGDAIDSVTNGDGDSSSSKDKSKDSDDGGSSDGGSDKPFVAEPPEKLKLTYVDGVITAHWDAADGAMRYGLILTDPTGTKVLDDDDISYHSFSASYTLPAHAKAGDYTAKIRTRSLISTSKYSSLVIIRKYEAPKEVKLSFVEDGVKVKVQWQGPADVSYNVIFKNHDRQLFTSTVTGNSATFQINNNPGTYTAEIYAPSDENGIPSDRSHSTVAITLLTAPALKTYSMKDGKFTATWRKVPDNNGYRYRIVDKDNKVVSPVISIGKDIQKGAVALPDNLPPGNYFPQVQVITGSANSYAYAWIGGSTDRALTKISAPELSNLRFEKGDKKSKPDRVTADWASIPHSSGYLLRLVDQKGAVFSTSEPIYRNAVTGSVPVPDDLPEGNYSLQARTKSGGDYISSAWGEATTTKLRRLPAPQLNNQSYAEEGGGEPNRMVADWSKVDDCGGYELRIIDKDGVERASSQLQPRTSGLVMVPDDLPAGRYKLQVRADYNTLLDISSAWSALAGKSVLKLSAPSASKPEYIADDGDPEGQLSAQWKAIANNDGYRLRLIDFKGVSHVTSKNTEKDVTNGHMDVPADLAAGYYQVAIQAIGDGSQSIISSDWGEPSKRSIRKMPFIDRVNSANYFAGRRQPATFNFTWYFISAYGRYKSRLVDTNNAVICAGPTMRGGNSATYSTSFPVPADLAPGKYIFQINTLAGDKTQIPSGWHAPKPESGKPEAHVEFTKLKDMKAPSLTFVAGPSSNRFSNGKIDVSWDVLDGCDGYKVELDGPGRANYKPNTDLKQDSDHCSIVVPQRAKPGSYVCNIKPIIKDANATIPGKLADPVSIDKLGKVKDVQVIFNGNNVYLDWTAVASATQYSVLITNSNLELVKAINVKGSKQTASIKLDELTNGGKYGVVVRAEDAAGGSIPGEKSRLLIFLNQYYSGPKKVMSQLRGPNVELTSTLKFGSLTRYEFKIVEKSSQKVIFESDSGPERVILVPLNTFSRHKKYQAFARCSWTNARSTSASVTRWSPPCDIAFQDGLTIVETISLPGSISGAFLIPQSKKLYYIDRNLSKVFVRDENADVTTVPLNLTTVYITGNRSTNSVYITPEIRGYSSGYIFKVSGEDNKVVKINLGTTPPSAFAVDSKGNRIFVSGVSGAFLSVVDGATDTEIKQVNFPPSAEGVAFDSVRNQIYVISSDGDLVIIDGESYSIQTISGVCNPGCQTEIAVNETKGKIYIRPGNRRAIHEIDCETQAIKSIDISGDPYGLAFDKSNNCLYICDITFGNLIEMNTETYSLRKIKVGQSPNCVFLDENNRKYVVNNGSNSISIVDDMEVLWSSIDEEQN